MPNVAVAVLGGASDSTSDSGNVAGQLNTTTFIINRTALLKVCDISILGYFKGDCILFYSEFYKALLQ